MIFIFVKLLPDFFSPSVDFWKFLFVAADNNLKKNSSGLFGGIFPRQQEISPRVPPLCILKHDNDH